MDIQTPKIDGLRLAVCRLRESDQTFALSLLKQFEKRGYLSDAQMVWVGKLTDRANGVQQQGAALDKGVLAIFRLFDKARAAGLKRPKIRLETEAGVPLVLARCGENSRYEGQVQITDGGPFGSNRYFGRIDASGSLQAGRDLNSDVSGTIHKLASDPEGTAAVYGRRTGTCCFCARHLDDARSIAVGYGPVCADKFGLGWGELKAETQIEVTLEEAA